MKKENLKNNLAKNLAFLMNARGVNRGELEKNKVITSRYISYIFNEERAASLTQIEKLANYFKIPAWMLIYKDLSLVYGKPDIDRLMRDYIITTEKGRETILNIAEREAEYSSVIDNKATQAALDELTSSTPIKNTKKTEY